MGQLVHAHEKDTPVMYSTARLNSWRAVGQDGGMPLWMSTHRPSCCLPLAKVANGMPARCGWSLISRVLDARISICCLTQRGCYAYDTWIDKDKHVVIPEEEEVMLPGDTSKV